MTGLDIHYHYFRTVLNATLNHEITRKAYFCSSKEFAQGCENDFEILIVTA